jgi:hypothetical protein
MADRTITGINNQKRSVSVLSVPLVEADILTTGSTYANLPARSLITSVIVNVATVSGTASSTIDVTAGGSVVANEVAVTVAGAIVGTVVSGVAYLATGGVIGVLAGAVTPADGAFVGDLIIEYIELDKTNGEYTN